MSTTNYDQGIALYQMYVINHTKNQDGIIKDLTEEQYNFVRDMKNEEGIFDSIFFKEQRKISEMEVEKLSGRNEANNASACPRCGGERYNVDKQTRSFDEGRSFYIKCGTCGLTESE